MTLHRRAFFTVFGMAALAASLQAGAVSFQVTVDTSSITPAATAGYIEVQFNQANTGALAGLASISGFTSSGFTFDDSTNAASSGVSGGLRTNDLSLPNDAGAANYFDQGVSTWGSNFSFLVTFTGALVGGTATDPSGFYFFLLDTSFNSLYSSGETGSILFDTNGAASGNASTISTVSQTPEPGTFAICGLGAGWMMLYRRKRK